MIKYLIPFVVGVIVWFCTGYTLIEVGGFKIMGEVLSLFAGAGAMGYSLSTLNT